MQSNVTQQRVPIHGDPGHWIHVSDSPRHVRVMFDRETIADSKRVKLVREPEVLPAYYFPKEDVRTDLFVPSQHKTLCPQKGEASYWSIRSGNKTEENAAWCYLNPLPENRCRHAPAASSLRDQSPRALLYSSGRRANGHAGLELNDVALSL